MAIGLVPLRDEISAIGEDYKRIERQIVKILLSIDVLNYKQPDTMKKKKRIESLVRQLHVIATKHTKRFIPKSYNNAKDVALVSLRVLGKEKVPAITDEIHKQAIDKFENDTIRTYLHANKTIMPFVERYFYLVGKVSGELVKLQEFGNLDVEDEAFLLKQIERGVEYGTSRQTIAARIKDFFQRNIDGGQLININGRYYNISKYSKLVARTEMRKCQSDGVVNSCRQHANDLVQVSDHGTLTIICKPYEGEIYSISGTSDKYEQLNDEPPYHPNCQHYLFPTSEEAMKFEQGYG